MQTTLNKAKERAIEHFMNELKGLDSIDLQRGISLYNSIKSDLVHWTYISNQADYLKKKIQSGEAEESDLINFINRIGRADSENLEFTFNCLYTVDEVLSLSPSKVLFGSSEILCDDLTVEQGKSWLYL